MKEEKSKQLEHLLFTTSIPTDKNHRCAVVLDKYHAITYHHGSVHSSFKKGDVVTLFNVVDVDYQVQAIVIAFSDTYDFTVFKNIKEEFRNAPIDNAAIYRGMPYLQLGITRDRKPVWKSGIISKRHCGYYLGTSHGEFGNSGSGIFDTYGQLCGISVAKKTFSFSGSNFCLSEVADHHPETMIISVDALATHTDTIESNDDFFPPKEKKPTQRCED